MICANCNTPNNNDDLFCFECGTPFSRSDSQETKVINTPGGYNFNPTPSYATPPPVAAKSKTALWAVLAVIAVAAIGAGAYFSLKGNSSRETFPDNFGFFVQTNEGGRVDKIPKQETNNAIQTKNDLLKNDNLPALDQNPNLIVYPDGNDIPVSDLKLVQLDTIKDDGNYKHLEIQAAKIDGKPEMRRLRVPDGLANGKYAFMLMDGFLNEGKHKLWAFQVKNSLKSDNNAALKDSAVALKPTPPPMPAGPKMAAPSAPAVPQPPNTTVRIVKGGTCVLRAAPDLSGAKIGNVYGGQPVYVINYGGNYDSWNGLYGNWAFVQTQGGKQGWVYSPLLR